MRVRKGSVYTYQPVLIDRCDARTNLRPGSLVRVIHPHGCPPPNTMGHCHIEDMAGRFVGLVCVGSLVKERP